MTTEGLLLPREVFLPSLPLKKPQIIERGDTCPLSLVSSSGEFDGDSIVSSLQDSERQRPQIESGFASFADFLEYSSSQSVNSSRRKQRALAKARRGMKLASRLMKHGFYGLCRAVVFALVNICAAVGLLFFLVF